MNPLLNLHYEPAFASLGEDFSDEVAAAEFPVEILRFRNDDVLAQLGLKTEDVTDSHFLEAFGKFQERKSLLAMRYHGYQFGTYNPNLGDGRGFLYGQVRGLDGELYDFGTKGSGTTPYSRGGDGRLTLKGGVREVLASEALHHLGVRTSRCLSLVETGEGLYRGDEPSPTRSSVMVRFSRSHIRFGTFERLHYFGRKDLVKQLLDHVIAYYYPHLQGETDTYARFFAELVQRVARLAAQWMSVGFCHAVLNTDNMSITGESFDYGPFAFMDAYNPKFTAAYFDHFGQYSYGKQPRVCHWNLGMLQMPLALVMPVQDLEAGLNGFTEAYDREYQALILRKLGFEKLADPLGEDLVRATLAFLDESHIGYHDFFLNLTRSFQLEWREHVTFSPMSEPWCELYRASLNTLPAEVMKDVSNCLKSHNPVTVLLRPRIETAWEAIAEANDWDPFHQLLKAIQSPFENLS
jgi:serine/tyrosine/threonine adenylyltransferase